MNYFSDDVSNILPFDDTKISFKKELSKVTILGGTTLPLAKQVYKEESVYNTFGFVKNKQKTLMPESIAFIREED